MKKVEHCLGTHLGDELIRVAVVEKVIILVKLVVNYINILVFREQVHLMGTIEVLNTLGVLHAGEHTWLDDDIFLVVDYRVQILCRHTEKVSYLIWQRTEIPDVCNRNHKLDVSLTLTADLLLSNLNAATVADNAFITYALVLTAGALVVFRRAEDALAEQAVTLRLVSAIVDGLRLGDLTIRILLNLLWRSETNGDLSEIGLYLCIFFESHILL